MITCTIQIGNSDDKLTQREWSEFVSATHKLADYHGDIHFSGFSVPDAVWQNACWVVEVHAADIHRLRDQLVELAQRFRQDAVAFTTGETRFVG
ncbi:MAG: hypothetical protein ACOC9B_06055 [Chloroflexota bacterium]